MVEIPDTLQHKNNESVYSKESWKHNINCSECKASIVGERYFCTAPPSPVDSLPRFRPSFMDLFSRPWLSLSTP